jgi:Streptogramin lyase
MTTNRAASSRLERSVHAEVEIVLHPIPTADSKPYIIVFGPDQQLWFCESGTSKIGRMNPGNGSFVEFDTPTPDSRPIGITRRPTARCGSARTPATGSVASPRRHDHRISASTPGAGPDGIVAGPDGNVWFSEAHVSRSAGSRRSAP